MIEYDKIIKKNKKTFVTIFARGEDIHLIKDVGMIPYLMYKNNDYDSYFVCYKNSDEYKNLETNVKGLKICFLKKRTNKYIDSILFLLKNAKNIDVLNLYHMRPYARMMTFLFKILNRKGKVYIKLDSPYVKYKYTSIINNKLFVKNCIKKCTLVSCESKKAVDLFNKDNLNIKYIPNGFLNYNNNKVKKDNIILSVGRLGTTQKATDILLETFKILKTKYNLKYNLVLIGPMDEDFKKEYEKFLEKNQKLSKDIKYLGEITERNKIEEFYEKSKVFLLPSRYESFGLVLVEAMSKGCYLVTTKFGDVVYDIVNDNKIGTISSVDDCKSLAENIAKYDENKDVDIDYRIKYAHENFEWNNISRKINEYLH